MVGRFDLLELEFLAPRDKRAPDKLIGGNHDENDGGEAAANSARVSPEYVAVWI